MSVFGRVIAGSTDHAHFHLPEAIAESGRFNDFFAYRFNPFTSYCRTTQREDIRLRLCIVAGCTVDLKRIANAIDIQTEFVLQGFLLGAFESVGLHFRQGLVQVIGGIFVHSAYFLDLSCAQREADTEAANKAYYLFHRRITSVSNFATRSRATPKA